MDTNRLLKVLFRKPSVEWVLGRLGLYRYLRVLYYRVSSDPRDGDRRKFPNWYRQFINSGELVFDVGANYGDRTECFLQLGARVVACEPVPELARAIRRRYNGKRLVVEQCAMGAEAGEATMHLSSYDTMGSLSEEWVERSKSANRLTGHRWVGTIQVPVRTLESLIAQYGMPAFVKIDVEGYEEQVLNGLVAQVPCLSFEFQPELLDSLSRCLARLDAVGTYVYNFSREETMEMAIDTWVNSRDLLRHVHRACETSAIHHGDIYARFRKV